MAETDWEGRPLEGVSVETIAHEDLTIDLRYIDWQGGRWMTVINGFTSGYNRTRDEAVAAAHRRAGAIIDRRTPREPGAPVTDLIGEVLATTRRRSGECHFCGLDVRTCDCH